MLATSYKIFAHTESGNFSLCIYVKHPFSFLIFQLPAIFNKLNHSINKPYFSIVSGTIYLLHNCSFVGF